MDTVRAPIRVAIINDYEIVVAGVAAVLAPFHERVMVMELDSGVPVLSDVDVILYDTFGAIQGDGIDLEDLVHGTDARVVIFSWNCQPELVEKAIARGARGYIPKATPGERIVRALEAVHAGKTVRPRRAEPADGAQGDWPGREHNLTDREAEVLALITQGLSNQEIADRSYLSINSVKTYIRTAYRKIGVTRRAQAVAWGMNHGFEPNRVRSIETLRP
ncbi:MAG: regulatory protein LuxR [Nocardioides sp.]|nr:regulatory protein LuxR [Nocardioides sp.]